MTRKYSIGRILKTIRVVAALIMLALATAFLCTMSAHVMLALGWVARIQIMPLAITSCLTAAGVWVAAALIFGRVYCAAVCPLGVMQDCFTRAWRMNPKQPRAPFRYEPPRNNLRIAVLLGVWVLLMIGFTLLPSLIDPYTAFGRIATQIVRPLVQLFECHPLMQPAWWSFLIALFTVAVLGVMAALWGRRFCNTVCPVGSALGIFSAYSLLHFDIDTDLCTNCRRCEYVCKAQCINLDDHTVDGSRCVVCFNCTDACPDGAIRYTTRRKRLSIPMMQKVQNAPTAMRQSQH